LSYAPVAVDKKKTCRHHEIVTTEKMRMTPTARGRPGGPTTALVLRAAEGLGIPAEVRFRHGRRLCFTTDGSGPSPLEALLASLAACEVITYRKCATELGVRLDHCAVEVEGTLEPSCPDDGPDVANLGVSHIRLVVNVDGPETPERYRQLADAVDRHCSVRTTLNTGVAVFRELAISGGDSPGDSPSTAASDRTSSRC